MKHLILGLAVAALGFTSCKSNKTASPEGTTTARTEQVAPSAQTTCTPAACVCPEGTACKEGCTKEACTCCKKECKAGACTKQACCTDKACDAAKCKCTAEKNCGKAPCPAVKK